MSPSANSLARAGGFCWLMTIVTGSIAMTGGSLGVAANLAATLFYLAATVYVYVLLRPVSNRLSHIAALFSYVGCALSILRVLQLAPPRPNPLALFGVHCILVGGLIYKSTFIPKVVGALLVIGGLCWLTFAAPAISSRLAPFNMIPGFVAELTVSLWLLIKGVNVARWDEMARATR
jgi:hypothetical protein